jgi:hypothetical protein
MTPRDTVVLRIFDGATSKPLARVVRDDAGGLVVSILKSGTVAREEALSGDPDQAFLFNPVKGIRMAIYAREIVRAIAQGRKAIPIDHPSSQRAVVGYRWEDRHTERAAEIRLGAEEAALDHWRRKQSRGMVAFFEQRVEDARQELAQIRCDTPKSQRKR